ncbi:hypothetical protein ACFOWB_13300 [Chenggangzhangella methanolivorans]|uniref:hypothetical protein n=1 Tax=Chenggangzhangella methanolivorans TaxID=1437009 RepID=UPI00361044DA
MSVAFTNPSKVSGQAIGLGAVTGMVLGQGMASAVQNIVAQANDRLSKQAYGAWQSELDAARGSAVHLADIAERTIAAYGKALNRNDDLEAEVARLRRAVAQRDAALGALSRRRAS